MAFRDTLILSRDDSSNKICHISKDSLDEELNKLSLAISNKKIEIAQEDYDSQHFTLNDIIEDESKDMEIEQLMMKIEDLESYINFRVPMQNAQDITCYPKKEGLSIFPKTFLDFSQSLDQAIPHSVDCTLLDLYKLIEEVLHTIKLVEAELKFTGRLRLGSFKIHINVNKEDPMIADKEELIQHAVFEPEKSSESHEHILTNLFSCKLESIFQETYDKIVFPNQPVIEFNKLDLQSYYSSRSSLISFLEYSNAKKNSQEETAKIRELDWQLAQAKAKKSYLFSKSKKLAAREEELRKLNKNISQQIVKNAKEREQLEEDINVFEKQKEDFAATASFKAEMITQVLQEIEDTKVESREDTQVNKSHFCRSIEPPSIIKEVPLEVQIKYLQEELVRLEREYKKSTIPETLETISTNIDRVKSNLLNLQSLKVIKSTERTSSAVRGRMKKTERNNENHSDQNSSKEDIKARNLPPRTISIPIKKLDVSTSRLDTSTLNSPSRRDPYLHKADNKEDIGLKMFLRKKEQELNDREEEIENEERRLFQEWSYFLERNDLVDILKDEVTEFRKLKKDLQKKISNLDKDRFDLRERLKCFEGKEKAFKVNEERLKENEREFERKKEQIYERLEWLKRKLVQFYV